MSNGYKKYLKNLKRNKIVILLSQIILLVIFISLWQILADNKIIDTFIFSSPKEICALLGVYLKTGELYKHILTSSYEVLLGLIFGTGCGIIIALILYEITPLAKIFDPFLVVLNALPKTALAPIFIIWIGANIKGIVFTAISISLIMTIMTAYKAFKNVSQEKIKLFKTFNAKKYQILFHLILPATIDDILNIIKLNIGMSWIGVIVGEFIVSKEGIGYLITYGTQVFKLDLVMMGILVLALISLLMYGFLNLLLLIYKKKRGW